MIVGVISGTDVGAGASTIVVPASSLTTPQAFQQAISDNAGKWLTVPAASGTLYWDFMSYGAEVDISALGGLTFQPGVEIVSNCPVRGILRASNKRRLTVEGFRARWEFDGGDILRPDLSWNESNAEMFDWINAWNAAFGTSISTATNGQGFNQRWDAYYTALETEAWNQISSSGRASGLLLNGCNEVTIFDFFANNCVAQINDQGGVSSGDGLYNFGTYIDTLKMGDDQRFGYLGKKGVATKIDRVICDVNGTRDNGGAPHIVYFSGNPLSTPNAEVGAALDIGSVQITDWRIAPAIKARESSINIGSIIGVRTQSLLGLVHCTGSIGPITSADQQLARDADGTTLTSGAGSKFVANFNDCYDLTVGVISAQQRASTVPLTQDSLRIADMDGCDNMRFQGLHVSCNRLSASDGMVRMSLTTNSSFGPSALTNTGTATVAMYDMPVDSEVGGTNSDNSFAPVACSTLATIAVLGGASKRNSFTVDPRLLTDGYVEGTTIDDNSFGASNNIILTSGERVVPLSAAPSFETKANTLFVMSRTDDPDADDPTDLNFTNGRSVTVDGREYFARTTLTGSGDEFKIATSGEGGCSTSIKRLRAAMNNELLGGLGSTAVSGASAIYNNGNNDHDTYLGVSSGRTLAVVNRTAGSAGNGGAMSTTEANGAWVSGVSAGGGLLDTTLMGSTLAFTTAASTITVAMPVTPPKGSVLAMEKVDTGAGTVDALGRATLSRRTDRVRLIHDGTAWRLPKRMAPASTTSGASLNLPHGTAPTSPVNGDIWTTTTGFFARLNSATTALAGLALSNIFTAAQTFQNLTTTFGSSVAGTLSLVLNASAGSTRRILFRSDNLNRWILSVTNDAESGLAAGSNFTIGAFDNTAGTALTKGNLAAAYRESGPVGGGNPYWVNMAGMVVNIPRATNPNGNSGIQINTDDTQPTITLGSNPLAVTNGSTTCTVTWTAHGLDTDSDVLLAGATAVGGVTPSGWYRIKSTPTANTFTITLSAAASSTATGGGSAVTAQAGIVSTAFKINHYIYNSGDGFPAGESAYVFAEPTYYIPTSTNEGGPSYKGKFMNLLSPQDTTQLNNWIANAFELNVTNRGADEGYTVARLTGERATTVFLATPENSPQFTGEEGKNILAAYSASRSGHSNSTNYFVRSYHGYNVEIGALVSNSAGVGGRGGTAFTAGGAYTPIRNNGIAITTGSAVGTFTVAGFDAKLITGKNTPSQVWIPASVTVLGVTFAAGVYSCTILTESTFSITGTGSGSSTGSGGGADLWVAFDTDVPWSVMDTLGWFSKGYDMSSARFTDNKALKFAPGMLIDMGGGVIWGTCVGSPNTVVTAPVGSMLTDTSGGAGTTLYVKESGTGNTGWAAK